MVDKSIRLNSFGNYSREVTSRTPYTKPPILSQSTILGSHGSRDSETLYTYALILIITLSIQEAPEAICQ